MLRTLEPLHAMLDRGPETMREAAFQQAFGQELHRAYEHCKSYRAHADRAGLHAAWDIYYHVFRRISKQISKLTVLELQHVSPKLLEARDLELAIPGTYQADAPVTKISSFARSMTVISSKQRPRKLTIAGSDGTKHAFLLKGHEVPSSVPMPTNPLEPLILPPTHFRIPTHTMLPSSSCPT